MPDDLPVEVLEACKDERIIFVFLQTPPQSEEHIENYLTWLRAAFKKVEKVDSLLHMCPRLFSWSSRVLLKSCPRGFKLFCNWFQEAHP